MQQNNKIPRIILTKNAKDIENCKTLIKETEDTQK